MTVAAGFIPGCFKGLWDTQVGWPMSLHLTFHDFLTTVYFKRERKVWKKVRETSMCKTNSDLLPLTRAPTRDETHNPGMCPDLESNQQPFALWDDARPTEPHQSGLLFMTFNLLRGGLLGDQKTENKRLNKKCQTVKQLRSGAAGCVETFLFGLIPN